MNDANGPAQRLWLKAYAIGSTEGWVIEPAPSKRDWMDDTYKKIAYRCLPLIAANMAGWVVRCPATFTAVWNGKMDNRGVEIRYADGFQQLTGTAISHFGSGVLTFVLPWLFRTSPGIGLLLRGLANHVKADAVPLDAVIETDWSPYTFTMNWKMVRGGVPVEFKKGDPVCMVQPFPLELLEQVDCSFEPFEAAPAEIRQGFHDFVNRRSSNIAVAPQGQYETQRDYFAGRYPDGSPARYPADAAGSSSGPSCPIPHREHAAPDGPSHRTTFDLKTFKDSTR
jgi:Family of unknown function (DUF6065)